MARKGIFGGILGGAKEAATPKRESRWTKVRDKFFGGTQVTKTTLTEKGNKTQVHEEKIDYNPDGSKRVQHRTMGDKI